MTYPAVFNYQKAVKANFNFLKAARNAQEIYLRAIPIEDEGFLLPVCDAHRHDEALIEKLTEWRNRHVEAYPTQFTATPESTSRWLTERLLAVPDRMLFLVTDWLGTVIGHIGFNGCINEDCLFEIDNVVRGVEDGPKGLFSKSMFVLVEWARKSLNVNGFFLRVMDDNAHAINFYERNGFVTERRIPLVREQRSEMISYREAASGEPVAKYFLRMIWAPESTGLGQAMILTAGPSVTEREGVYAYDAALHGWNRNWSGYLSRFERQFAEYVSVKYALATSSCTGALQIALMALDIGPGDEVIVPDLTWVATANAVRYVGATPVFADIELDTWNLDVNSVEQLITDKTKAIMPVHMYGHPARMTGLVSLAQRHNLKIVEDAAPAIGAEWQGQRCGSFGDFAGFSFQGAKLLVTGEGGMLVTDNEALYQKALKIWDQGRNPARAFWIDADGVKFKMSNIQAAIGLAQLERSDELIEMKRRIFSWYQDGLADLPHITLNGEVAGARSIYWMSSLRLDEAASVTRDGLMEILKQYNIDSRPVFPAISQYPVWTLRQASQPVALRVGAQALNLPSGVCLKKAEADYICRIIRQAF